ncbi:MAG: precorrin-6A reductase [Cyanobacteria bacterium P01_F01_bin.153]
MTSSVKVWLIGGTSDSRTVAQVLSDRQIPWIATVVSSRAQRLYNNLPGEIHAGPLTADALPRWIREHRITHIVDGSHPFAVEISSLAIASTLPYLRYERPAVDLAPLVETHPNIVAVSSWDKLFAEALFQTQPRILLTTGLKSLQQVVPILQQADWWARVLPTSQELAIALGFPRNRLILQRPPVSAAAEKEQWRSLGINTVLTKASGAAGGLPEKIAAAIALQTRLLILQRPCLPYPHQVHNDEGLSNHLDAWFGRKVC